MKKQTSAKQSDPIVTSIVDGLDAKVREEFEERAAIIEFDAKQTRAHAEALALLDVLSRHPFVLTGITVQQVDLDGATQWVLATKRGVARPYPPRITAVKSGEVDLVAVVEKHYGGFALLTKID